MKYFLLALCALLMSCRGSDDAPRTVIGPGSVKPDDKKYEVKHVSITMMDKLNYIEVCIDGIVYLASETPGLATTPGNTYVLGGVKYMRNPNTLTQPGDRAIADPVACEFVK